MFNRILLDHDEPHVDHEGYSILSKFAEKYPKYSLRVIDLLFFYTQIFSEGGLLHQHTP